MVVLKRLRDASSVAAMLMQENGISRIGQICLTKGLNKMKLFLVADGDYSEYHVCGIFSTIEKAEHAKKWFDSNQDIEEIEVDELPDHPEGMFWYSFYMKENGDTLDIWIEDGSYSRPEIQWFPNECQSEKCVKFQMWATDEKHSVKIANEKRSQLIASNQWTLDYDEWRRKLIDYEL